MKNAFFRGHGLGNDYLAVDPDELTFSLSPQNIRTLCDRHVGIGSDGILALRASATADFGLRIFNPDGSEAEKSGNGLRIFGCYLYHTRRTRRRSFSVETKGGIVCMQLHINKQGEVEGATVEMGRASFSPRALPCRLSVPELVQQPIQVAGRRLIFTGVSVGNPHCVLFRNKGGRWTREELLSLGPAIENHAWFPRRTNVQLAVPTGRNSLSILIWERGAGETRASGSSACAAACAAVRSGFVKSPVRVSAPGGSLHITVNPDFHLTMQGPVAEVARGQLSSSFVRPLR